MRKVLMLIFMLILSLPSLCLAFGIGNDLVAIPEPATIFLLGSGLAGIGALKMWRRIKSKR
jgi:hypothetical protein